MSFASHLYWLEMDVKDPTQVANVAPGVVVWHCFKISEISKIGDFYKISFQNCKLLNAVRLEFPVKCCEALQSIVVWIMRYLKKFHTYLFVQDTTRTESYRDFILNNPTIFKDKVSVPTIFSIYIQRMHS